MGLIKEKTFAGITLPEAYHRIDRLNLNGTNVFVAVGSYVTQADADGGEQPFKTTEISLQMAEAGITKANFNVKKIYDNVVKVKQEFDLSDAVDA